MIKIKNERGITLIALILTIIVALILVTITVRTGTDSIEHSRMVSFVSRMQLIQKKVDFLAENGGYNDIGKDISEALEDNQIESLDVIDTIITKENLITRSNNSALKYFPKEDIPPQLEIESIDDNILIDFKTREVISLNGIEYEGETYYTQYNLPGGQKVEQHTDTERTLRFNEPTVSIDGLKATFTISGIGITNGTLSYTTNYNSENPTWTVITNYTVKDKTVTITNLTRSGTYYFKLVDNITGKEYKIEKEITDEETEETSTIKTYPSVTLRLTNSPQLKGNLVLNTDKEENEIPYNYSDLVTTDGSRYWAYATDTVTGDKYVWIPRFAYEKKNTANIEFLRGTSNVTTSDIYATSDWMIHSVFKDVTGIWVKVDYANEANLPYIDNIIDNKLENLIIL